MIERRLAPGEVLFAGGEASELVGRIESGAVEVVRRAGDRDIVLARLGRAEYVSETGVLEGRLRAATVRAVEPTRLVLFGREAFLEDVARAAALDHRLLVSSSERLHRADLALAGALPASPRQLPAPSPRLRLFAESEALARARSISSSRTRGLTGFRVCISRSSGHATVWRSWTPRVRSARSSTGWRSANPSPAPACPRPGRAPDRGRGRGLTLRLPLTDRVRAASSATADTNAEDRSG